eukprot:TRINITY_DN3663_c0_g1_i1.p1 TRINITY_DN3663_c0_g1~~TRINITY_DN3663_c0_g1_i1.p1  ORF type:complete len:242 (+),score=100.64 TRINITY_DN3663_c0_g1_i1:66-791(+)
MDTLFDRKIDFNAVFKNTDIEPHVRDHLARVYSALGLTLFCASFGCLAHLQFNLGGTLSAFATCLALIWLVVDPERNNPVRRVALLSLVALFKGCTLGPLVERALQIDPSVLVTAFLGTTTVFVCFTGSALLSRRRSFLYLGGILSSLLTFMVLLSLLNLFLQSAFIPLLHLYMGLFVFCAYVLFDTQLIIEKASRGDTDYAWHAVELFLDFVSIFVRILMILMQNGANDKKKKTRRERED